MLEVTVFHHINKNLVMRQDTSTVQWEITFFFYMGVARQSSK